LRLSIGYPDYADERQLVHNLRGGHPIDRLGQVVSIEELLAAQDGVDAIHVDDSLYDYVLQIVRATRAHTDVALGASPRGTMALFKAAQALAAVRGRDFVVPDDVKYLAPYTLAHRLIVRPESQLRGRTGTAILQGILETTAVPVAASSNGR
jgi:MoxR-like ATPase